MPPARHPLPRAFYDRPSPAVARDLLGCRLLHAGPQGLCVGRIVEVEAYLGRDDPASHAARGLTARNAPMFGPPGHAYVYRIYGLHDCFNVVTGAAGDPMAVLVRAVEVEALPPGAYPRADGPGRLCRAFGISRHHDRADLCRAGPGCLWITTGPAVRGPVATTPRIGVADPRALRWFDPASGSVSGPRAARAAAPAGRLG